MKKLLFLIICITFLFTLTGCQLIKKAEPVNTNEIVPTENLQKETNKTVPLPTAEDIIRTFFQLIDEDRIPEAIAMMSPTIVPDDSTKQAYGVAFNAFDSVSVTNIKKLEDPELTAGREVYQVDFEAKIKPEKVGQVMYEDGINTRFITLKKYDNIYKIEEINTGP